MRVRSSALARRASRSASRSLTGLLGRRGRPVVALLDAIAHEPGDGPDDGPGEDAGPEAAPDDRRHEEENDAAHEDGVPQRLPRPVGPAGHGVERDGERHRRKAVVEAVERAGRGRDDGQHGDRREPPCDQRERHRDGERHAHRIERVPVVSAAVPVPAAVAHRAERHHERKDRDGGVEEDERERGLATRRRYRPGSSSSRPRGGRESPLGRTEKLRLTGVSERW